MKNVLEVKYIIKYYESDGNVTKALNNITFDVKKGEFVTIMGASGSGKTTLLNLIATFDKKTSGEISIDGVQTDLLSEKALRLFRLQKLGFVFQDFALLDTLTGYDNIALCLAIKKLSPKEIDEKINIISKELDINDILNKYPYQMSGGQKQRVACARALITNPEILLLDEPTGALDSSSSRTFLEKLTDINTNLKTTILMVTHDAFCASYSSRVIFIKDGVIFKELKKDKLSNKDFYKKIMSFLEVV